VVLGATSTVYSLNATGLLAACHTKQSSDWERHIRHIHGLGGAGHRAMLFLSENYIKEFEVVVRLLAGALQLVEIITATNLSFNSFWNEEPVSLTDGNGTSPPYRCCVGGP
jgi:hypothetical protein